MKRHALLTILALAALLAGCTRPPSTTVVVYQAESPFNNITVRDTPQGRRELLFDGRSVQSAMRLDDPKQLAVAYVRASMAGLAFVPDPRRILIIGLGGGSMPMFLRRAYPNAQIDVAELDPAVIDVATRFFGFKQDDKLKAHAGDGRQFVQTAQVQYDIIFLDAYGADSIPYLLATREFLTAVKARTAPGGVVVANVWEFPGNTLYYSMLKTYQDVFPELHCISVSETSNCIFLATPAKTGMDRDRLVARARQLSAPGVAQLDLPTIIEQGYEQDLAVPPEAKVLLDADAPRE